MKRYLNNDLWIINTPNSTILGINVPIQPKVSFITAQSFLVKTSIGGQLVLNALPECAKLYFLYELHFERP